jgi:BCS1 N terminal
MVDLKKGSPWESVVLTTLSRDRNIFRQLLSEARQIAVELQEGKTMVYTCWGLDWRPFGQPRRKRPLSSVILDRGVKDRIVQDVKDFLQASAYYYERGRTEFFPLFNEQEYPIEGVICCMALREAVKPVLSRPLQASWITICVF